MKFAHVIFPLLLMALSAAAETQVRIVGMETKSEQEMLLMMGGRLAHIRAAPASAPLADDAAFILRQLLEKDGYFSATVGWKITGREEVELIVREGLRLSLGKVTLRGVPAGEEQDLVKLYERPSKVRRDFGSGAPPFREEHVETGLSFLRQELNARGHWEAEAEVSRRETDPATGAVDLDIDVRPGPLFRIGRPTATSTVPQHAASAIASAQPFVGRKATTAHLNEMRLAVESTFTRSGYPDAKIQMIRTLDDGKFIPGFHIDLGERVRLGRIDIEGLERTDPARISGRFRGLEGDWYDETAMNLRLREFLATGAFSYVRLDREPAGEGMVDATLHFEEAKAREISLGAGVGSYQGVIARAGYSDRNLSGKLMELNTGIELSLIGLLGEVRVTNPWLFGTDTAATARAYALVYGREGYTSYESGIDGKLTWKFGKHYTLDLLAGYSLVNLTGEGLPSAELGETVYTNPKLRVTQMLDFRDSPVLPKSGWHLKSPLEIGAAIGDDSTSYAMAALSGGWYHQINRQYGVGIGGEFGMLMPSGDGRDLPIDLRLFNGGSRSVRSFPERELGTEVKGYPVGGEAMWNTNFELIRRITDSVKAVAFVDAGALSRDYSGIGSEDIEIATGLGIRLDLPIGPVRFEYGYNLTRDEGEPTGTFHFAIGTAY